MNIEEKRYNNEVYEEVKDYINSDCIDVNQEEFIKAIDYYNCGGYDDFLITWECIEYDNLGVNDFIPIDDGRDVQSGEKMYINLNKLGDFKFELIRYNNNSLRDYLESYELI